MAISQSGSQLILVFNDLQHTTLLGELSGTQISASVEEPGVTFQGQVDPQADQDRMEGSLRAAECPGGTKLAGRRVSTTLAEGSGH